MINYPLLEVFLSVAKEPHPNQIVPGHFFHRDGNISIPWRFSYIQHRFRLGGGSGMEIDVNAAAGSAQLVTVGVRV